MAKVRICDGCGKIVKDIYDAEFREYYCGYDGMSPIWGKRKQKIDLCKDCYTKLFEIKENSNEKKQ